ncbi:glycosyltransferase [bacterium]|nr:glycosyltransferase [bacterium]
MNVQNIKKQPTLSLCMIVKDEEYFLPQCLDILKDVVDEIIIVDTGSTDKTVEIAESYGAKVYHHPWEGDFSKARNISLSYAASDWIIVIDPDEELDRDDIPILLNALNRTDIDVIFCIVSSETKEGWTRHSSHRVFRRGKAHYSGIVHNQLIHGEKKLNTSVRIYHYGYNLPEDKMVAKYKRTQALLEKQVKVEPENAYVHFNYLRVMRAQKRFKEGVSIGKKALTDCVKTITPIHRQMIVHDTAYCLIQIGRATEAEQMIGKVLKDYPDNLDLIFTISAALVAKKKYKEALLYLQHFLKVKEKERISPKVDLLLVDTYTMEDKIWANIGDCYHELGKYEKGAEAANKAIALRPDIADYKRTLALNLCRLDRFNEARTVLESAVSNERIDPSYYVKWSFLCNMYPSLGVMEQILEQGLCVFPQSDELHNHLAAILAEKSPDKAIKNWEQILRINPNHVGAYLGLIQLALKVADSELLDKLLAQFLVLEEPSEELLLKVAKILIKNQKHERSILVLNKYLDKRPDDSNTLVDLATCHAKIGQYEVAFMGYRAALNLDPHNPQIIQNLKVLEKMIRNNKG